MSIWPLLVVEVSQTDNNGSSETALAVLSKGAVVNGAVVDGAVVQDKEDMTVVAAAALLCIVVVSWCSGSCCLM